MDVFKNPKHPYTLALINSHPGMSTDKSRLNVIPGNIPDLSNLPTGCPFSPRCQKTMDVCRKEFPQDIVLENEHRVACWLHQ